MRRNEGNLPINPGINTSNKIHRGTAIFHVYRWPGISSRRTAWIFITIKAVIKPATLLPAAVKFQTTAPTHARRCATVFTAREEAAAAHGSNSSKFSPPRYVIFLSLSIHARTRRALSLRHFLSVEPILFVPGTGPRARWKECRCVFPRRVSHSRAGTMTNKFQGKQRTRGLTPFSEHGARSRPCTYNRVVGKWNGLPKRYRSLSGHL